MKKEKETINDTTGRALKERLRPRTADERVTTIKDYSPAPPGRP